MDTYLDKVHAQGAHDHNKIKESCRVAMKQMVKHCCYMYQNAPGQDNLHSHMTCVITLSQTTTASLVVVTQTATAAATNNSRLRIGNKS